MKLGNWPKYQKLHIYSLLAKVPEVAHILSFYTMQGVEVELIFALWTVVSEIRANFQNWTYLGIWNLAIGQSCTYTSSLLQGVVYELILALWAAVSETWADFKNCHMWAWNLAISQSSRSCTDTLFLPQGVKIELNFALWAVVSEIWAIFKIAISGH